METLKPPVLETQRLILRIPTADDAARMADYVTYNREHLTRWEPAKPDGYYTADFWSERLPRFVEQFNRGEALRMVLVDRNNPSGAFQGQCGFTEIVRGPMQAAFLGYSIDRQKVGRGLMYEALTAAIEYAFAEMNLHRIMANYMPANERSGRLLRRLGFTVDGYARDYLLLNGKWEDHILTSLVNNSWKSS
ncbi:MAG TPA: GNAT family N-acetyltransferase [Blastocatellia bacterium]|nr:GNAT family N-acetyltransferase [Blastocatellia bacterium]